MGRGGGGLTRNEFTQERSESRTRKVIWEMGFVGLWVWVVVVVFFFFMVREIIGLSHTQWLS